MQSTDPQTSNLKAEADVIKELQAVHQQNDNITTILNTLDMPINAPSINRLKTNLNEETINKLLLFASRTNQTKTILQEKTTWDDALYTQEFMPQYQKDTTSSATIKKQLELLSSLTQNVDVNNQKIIDKIIDQREQEQSRLDLLVLTNTHRQNATDPSAPKTPDYTETFFKKEFFQKAKQGSLADLTLKDLRQWWIVAPITAPIILLKLAQIAAPKLTAWIPASMKERVAQTKLFKLIKGITKNIGSNNTTSGVLTIALTIAAITALGITFPYSSALMFAVAGMAFSYHLVLHATLKNIVANQLLTQGLYQPMAKEKANSPITYHIRLFKDSLMRSLHIGLSLLMMPLVNVANGIHVLTACGFSILALKTHRRNGNAKKDLKEMLMQHANQDQNKMDAIKKIDDLPFSIRYMPNITLSSEAGTRPKFWRKLKTPMRLQISSRPGWDQGFVFKPLDHPIKPPIIQPDQATLKYFITQLTQDQVINSEAEKNLHNFIDLNTDTTDEINKDTALTCLTIIAAQTPALAHIIDKINFAGHRADEGLQSDPLGQVPLDPINVGLASNLGLGGAVLSSSTGTPLNTDISKPTHSIQKTTAKLIQRTSSTLSLSNLTDQFSKKADTKQRHRSKSLSIKIPENKQQTTQRSLSR
jgi:hypothetical protein